MFNLLSIHNKKALLSQADGNNKNDKLTKNVPIYSLFPNEFEQSDPFLMRKGVSAGGLRKQSSLDPPHSSQGPRSQLNPPFIAGGRPSTQQSNNRNFRRKADSALRLQHINSNLDGEEFYFTRPEEMDSLLNPGNKIVNNAFPQFPVKSEGIVSHQVGQKFFQKVIQSRPETTKVVQDRFMDLFNQPKNLFSQVLSIQNTQTQANKFFTENRAYTASTRADSLKINDSNAEIKDLKALEEQERKQNMKISTIDRARTALDGIRRKQKMIFRGQNKETQLEGIFSKEELSKGIPQRAGTAMNLDYLSSNDNVLIHIKKLIPPKSSQSVADIRAQSHQSQRSDFQKYQNKFPSPLNQNNYLKMRVTSEEKDQILEEEREISIVNKGVLDNLKGSNINTEREGAEKIDREGGDIKSESEKKVNNIKDKNIEQKQQQQQGKDSAHKIQLPNIKIDKDKTDTKSSHNAPNKSVPTFTSRKSVQNHIGENKDINQQQDLTDRDSQIPTDETIYELDVNADTLSKAEVDYINKMGKMFYEDIKPHFEKYQNQFAIDIDFFHKQLVIPPSHSVKNEKFTLPSKVTIKIREIEQENINEPEKGFYDHPTNIRASLLEFGEELHSKYNKYNDFCTQEHKRFQDQKDQFICNFLKTNEEGISVHELGIMRKEYQKPPDERNYDFLDSVAIRLKFFKKFTQPTRIYLLKLANIMEYPPNSMVFNQGDEGDLMYVIIRGACHVRIKTVKPDGGEDNQVVATLYDGMQFGELALMNAKKSNNLIKRIKMNEIGQMRIQQVRTELQKQPIFQSQAEENKNQKETTEEQETAESKERKYNQEQINKLLEEANRMSSRRAASIETCEQTSLFTVSRDYFKTILLGLIQKELDVKLKLLQSLASFEYMDPLTLIPLANLIEIKKYKLGEILLREGEEPNKFFIVSSGRLKLVKEELIVRSNFCMGRDHKLSKKNFMTGTTDYTKICQSGQAKREALVDNASPSLSDRHALISDRIQEDEDTPLKAANYELIFENETNIGYHYQHEFGSLVRGDTFFGRSILLEYLKIDPSSEEDYSSNPRDKAKLTVIADSAEAEVYVLEKYQTHLLPNILRRTMIEGLITRKEYDSVYTKEVDQWIKHWDKYKSDMLENLKKNQKYSKNQLN